MGRKLKYDSWKNKMKGRDTQQAEWREDAADKWLKRAEKRLPRRKRTRHDFNLAK